VEENECVENEFAAEPPQVLAFAKCVDAFGIANIAVSAITAPKENIDLFISSQSELQYKTSSFANMQYKTSFA